MSWKEWEACHNALTTIAQREQPERTCWYSWGITKLDYQCLICGLFIENSGTNGGGGMFTNAGLPRHFSTLREHGLTHLKERNLLPFI